jgi:hypothetical protein
MKYLFSIFFVFGIILSGINFGFSANFECCYDGTTVRPVSIGNCVGESDIILNGISSSSACKDIRDERVSCVRSGKTYCDAAGKVVFDNVQIKGFYTGVCDGGFPVYDSATCDITPVVDEPGTGDTTPGDNTGGSDVENPYTDDEIARLNVKCANGGGFLGLFTNKESCNSVALSGDNKCIFNPYLGGNFKSDLLNMESYGVIDFESESCVVDKALRSCSDLKIRSICDGADSIEIENLDGTCRWVESDGFVSSAANSGVDSDGICVSKEISDTKYFNKKDFYFTSNVVLNPSFESSLGASWGIINGQFETDGNLAHFGNNYVLLNSDGELSQELEHLKKNISYKLNFQMRSASSNLDGELSVFYGGEQIGNLFRLGSLSSDSYGEYKLNDLSFRPKITGGKIEFKFTGSGSIHLDSISLKIFDVLSPTDDSNEIFSPVNIIPAQASNCNLCFTDLGFNFCTEDKSDLLGACSYMTTSPNLPYGEGVDLSKYLGNSGNKLLTEQPWVSQSLPDSQLFCELYIDEAQCVDPNNYVNLEFGESHLSTSPFGTLCKWRPEQGVGCYKDSNGDDEFDTINNYANVIGTTVRQENYNDEGAYARDDSSSSSLKFYGSGTPVTDFDLACDILPPNVHVALTGRNVAGDTIFVGLNSNDDIIGDVYLEVLATDLILESCKDYNIPNLLYIEYTLGNGKNFTTQVTSNQYILNPIKINEFLVNAAGESLFTGATTLDVKIIDQSGNVGKIWSFDLNVDNVGPVIDLIDPVSTFYGEGDFEIDTTIVGLGQNLTFKFTDDTIVDYCDYNLVALDGANPDHFNDSGNMSFVSSGNVDYDFTLPITNSSADGDGYVLEVECFDIFNQSSLASIYFEIDVDTRIVLISPKGFKSETAFSGFLNETTQVVLTSTDASLFSCELLDFENLDAGLAPLVVSDYDFDLHSDLLGDESDVGVKKIVTGEIGFSVDGNYTGKYSCSDELGNTFSAEYTYYYDTAVPGLVSFDILQDNSSKFVDVSTGNIYLRGDDSPDYNLKVNLTLDGTGSWIDYSLSTLSNFGSHNGTIENAWFNRAELLNYSFMSDMIMDVNIVKQFTPGVLVDGEFGLRNITLNLEFFDKAGNFGNKTFSYFYDDSNPTLNFSGDVVDLDSSDDLIFSRISDPNVEVSFTAPSYREFSCSVVLKRNGQRSLEGVYDSGNSFEFKISDLDVKGWFSDGLEVLVVVMCEDIFGETLNEEFTLIYDNTPLMLTDFGLASGEDIYSRINTDYNPLLDNLFFNFNDTNEQGGYMCSFRFNKVDSNYDCSTNFTKLSRFDRLDYVSSIQSIISGYGITHLADESNYFCERTSAFSSFESLAFRTEVDYPTKLELEVLCMDGPGFNVSGVVPINYTYLTGGLISFDYEYVGLDNVRFIVTSLVDYSDIVISFTEDGSAELTRMSRSDPRNDGTFVYISTDYSIADIIEGESIIYAVAFDSTVVDGFLSTDFFVDKTLPIGNLTIQDINENDEIFDDIFKLGIAVTDEVSGLNNVDLFVNNVLIAHFNEFNFTLFDTDYGIELTAFANALFVNSGKTLEVDLLFGEATLNDVYTFKMVATDNVGRELVDEITVKYADGIYLELVDSSNAVVYNKGYGWLTKSITPILKFETSKIVTCKMTSTKGGFVLLGPTGTEFTFDLSTRDGFNLTELGDEVDFKLECSNDESTYKFTKTLFLNDKLLDYVLIPADGFLVNERPYYMSAQIRSVGPFSKMTCSYSYGGKTFVSEIEGGYKNINLNFSGLSSGNINLDFNCKDSIDNFGPNKRYVFELEVNGPLILDDSSLVLISSDGYESVLEGSNELFIHSTSGVDLSFNLNKKGIEYCEYGIDPVGGVLTGFVNFFRGLFNVERYNMISTTPYEFAVYGLSFTNPTSELEILCYDDIGGRVSKTYNVIYINNDILVEAQRISE